MIDYLKIEGFKSIKKMEIELKPINILIGGNGSGKSNFVSFFEFLDNLYNKKLQDYIGLRGGIEKYIHKGNESSNAIEGMVKFSDGVNGYSFVVQPSGDSFVISEEALWYYNNPLIYKEYTKEAQIKNNGWYRGKYIQQHLTGHKKYHFHDTGKDSPFNSTAHIQKDISLLYDKGENLAAILYIIREEHPKIYNRIVRTIQSIAPYFSDFVLQPNDMGYLKLFWQDKYSQYNYGVNDLSDGSLRFIAMAVLFMQPTLPKTIVLDEPELGLHPQAIGKLAGMIQAAATSSQVIIATQSADLISNFNPEDIIAVDQKDGRSVFQRLNRADLDIWLQDYSLGELWQRNIINMAQPFNNIA